MSRERPIPDGAWPRVPNAALLRAFDYVAAACFGAVAAIAAWYVVPAGPPAFLQMVLGMAVGMASSIPLLGLFSWLLGGFEIVVLSMQAGMFAGMLGSMTSSTTAGDVAFEGILVGLMVQILLHAVDRSLTGEVKPDV